VGQRVLVRLAKSWSLGSRIRLPCTNLPSLVSNGSAPDSYVRNNRSRHEQERCSRCVRGMSCVRDSRAGRRCASNDGSWTSKSNCSRPVRKNRRCGQVRVVYNDEAGLMC
jgi:hypothetical protein